MEQGNRVNPGWLYLCATPIGNLEDITLRVLHTLEQVDFIACEDTRHTLRLLNHFGISKPLISCHEHNERDSAEKIADRLAGGECAAMVTDAGTPGISDPGTTLVQTCIRRKIPFTVLPGACAAVSALVLSGLAGSGFVFFGFLPRTGRERRETMKELMNQPRTAVFYESPLRLQKTISEMAEIEPARQIAVARELTKIHETVFRGTLQEAEAYFETCPPKGELVLVLQEAQTDRSDERYAAMPVEEALDALMKEGLEKKEAVRQLAHIRGVRKDTIYKVAMKMTKNETNLQNH